MERRQPFTTRAGRSRIFYGLLTIAVLLLGLLSRRIPDNLPFVRDAVGDGLWALLVFFGLAFVFNRWSSKQIALAALLFSFAIEIGQLYHAPWIDGLRATRFGGLVLGHSFVWTDLLWYTAGVVLGFGIGHWITRRYRQG